jgi:hypothetical protein
VDQPLLRNLLGAHLGPVDAFAAAYERITNGTNEARVADIRSAYLATAQPAGVGFLDSVRNAMPNPKPVKELKLFNLVLLEAVELGNEEGATRSHRYLYDLLRSDDGKGKSEPFNFKLLEAASAEDVLDWEEMAKEFNMIVFSSGLSETVTCRGLILKSVELRRKSVGHLLAHAKLRARKIITRTHIGTLDDDSTRHGASQGEYDHRVDQVPSTVSPADAFAAGPPTNLAGVGARTLNNQTVYHLPPVEFMQPESCHCGVVIRTSMSHKSDCPIDSALRWFANLSVDEMGVWENQAARAADVATAGDGREEEANDSSNDGEEDANGSSDGGAVKRRRV